MQRLTRFLLWIAVAAAAFAMLDFYFQPWSLSDQFICHRRIFATGFTAALFFLVLASSDAGDQRVISHLIRSGANVTRFSRGRAERGEPSGGNMHSSPSASRFLVTLTGHPGDDRERIAAMPLTAGTSARSAFFKGAPAVCSFPGSNMTSHHVRSSAWATDLPYSTAQAAVIADSLIWAAQWRRP